VADVPDGHLHENVSAARFAVVFLWRYYVEVNRHEIKSWGYQNSQEYTISWEGVNRHEINSWDHQNSQEYSIRECELTVMKLIREVI
jgi:hypothetical protein